MDRTQGYLLPDGDLGEDEIACTVVFYPDRPEYRAALQGSLAYLATWIAWEKDANKRGKDAADNWREAYEHTLECWRMGCFEQLTDNVAAILLLLQSKKDCCDTNITYNTQTIIVTTITPGIGDPPETWGDGEPITTWEEWGEYVCYHAHAYVDKLVENAETLHDAVAIGAVGIGTIGAILAGLTFIGLAVPVAWLIAAGIAAAAFYFAEDIFEDTATDIEAARAEIVCSIMLGTGLGEAVQDAITSGQAWLQFFQYIDYDTATAIIYEGGYNGEYLASETSEICDCDDGYGDLLWQWTAGHEGWSWQNRADFGLPSGASFPGVDYDGWASRYNGKNPSGNAAIKITGDELRDQAGLATDDNMTIRKIYGIFWNAGVDFTKEGVVRIWFEDLTSEDLDTGVLSATPEYMEWSVVGSSKNLREGNNFVIEIIHEHNGSTSDRYMFVDDFTVEWISS